MKTIIIIPTYNERDNIAVLVTELQDQFERRPCKTSEMRVSRKVSPEIHPKKSLRN